MSKAWRILGWRPEVSLAEGAERTVAYFRERAGLDERAIA